MANWWLCIRLFRQREHRAQRYHNFRNSIYFISAETSIYVKSKSRQGAVRVKSKKMEMSQIMGSLLEALHAYKELNQLQFNKLKVNISMHLKRSLGHCEEWIREL